MTLQVVNFQRCEHAFHQCQAWVESQLALHLLLLIILQLSHLPSPLPSLVSNSSCLFTGCQSLYDSCCSVPLSSQGTVPKDWALKVLYCKTNSQGTVPKDWTLKVLYRKTNSQGTVLKDWTLKALYRRTELSRHCTVRLKIFSLFKCVFVLYVLFVWKVL